MPGDKGDTQGHRNNNPLTAGIPLPNRRKTTRYPFSLEAMLTIMVPEETFSPKKYRAVTVDLSLGGVRAKSYQLTRDDYLWMIKGVRLARLEVQFPGSLKPVELRGHVVWIDFHDASPQEPANCVLGVSFQKQAPEVEEAFNNALASLRQEVRKDVEGFT